MAELQTNDIVVDETKSSLLNSTEEKAVSEEECKNTDAECQFSHLSVEEFLNLSSDDNNSNGDATSSSGRFTALQLAALCRLLTKIPPLRWLELSGRLKAFYRPHKTTPKLIEKHMRLSADQVRDLGVLSNFRCQPTHVLTPDNFQRILNYVEYIAADKHCEEMVGSLSVIPDLSESHGKHGNNRSGSQVANTSSQNNPSYVGNVVDSAKSFSNEEEDGEIPEEETDRDTAANRHVNAQPNSKGRIVTLRKEAADILDRSLSTSRFSSKIDKNQNGKINNNNNNSNNNNGNNDSQDIQNPASSAATSHVPSSAPQDREHDDATCSLLLSNLPIGVTNQELLVLLHHYSGCVTLQSSDIMMPPNKHRRKGSENHSGVHAYVQFKRIKDARKAKLSLENRNFDDRTISVEYSLGRPTNAVWIGGIPSALKQSEIEEFMAQFGSVDRIDFRQRASVGDSFAFVVYPTTDIATNAVRHLTNHQCLINGKVVRVGYSASDLPNTNRTAGPPLSTHHSGREDHHHQAPREPERNNQLRNSDDNNNSSGGQGNLSVNSNSRSTMGDNNRRQIAENDRMNSNNSNNNNYQQSRSSMNNNDASRKYDTSQVVSVDNNNRGGDYYVDASTNFRHRRLDDDQYHHNNNNYRNYSNNNDNSNNNNNNNGGYDGRGEFDDDRGNNNNNSNNNYFDDRNSHHNPSFDARQYGESSRHPPVGGKRYRDEEFPHYDDRNVNDQYNNTSNYDRNNYYDNNNNNNNNVNSNFNNRNERSNSNNNNNAMNRRMEGYDSTSKRNRRGEEDADNYDGRSVNMNVVNTPQQHHHHHHHHHQQHQLQQQRDQFDDRHHQVGHFDQERQPHHQHHYHHQPQQQQQQQQHHHEDYRNEVGGRGGSQDGRNYSRSQNQSRFNQYEPQPSRNLGEVNRQLNHSHSSSNSNNNSIGNRDGSEQSRRSNSNSNNNNGSNNKYNNNYNNNNNSNKNSHYGPSSSRPHQ